ncbi:MAG: hypothetical protein L3J79_12880 [Candidatus Marinimicrobia bacterium]|nr:hypothetical protein [Candidatus Neomarinimicrobiota bacterium]
MRFFILIPVVATFCVFILTGPAFALQTHGSPEGLYAHQLAHLFFIMCMGSFAYRIHCTRQHRHQGWIFFALGGILLVAWNLWALTGHFVSLYISKENFILPEGRLVPLLHITSWKEILYYILKMDHLLSVPALICFYFGLKSILSTFPRESGADKTRSP